MIEIHKENLNANVEKYVIYQGSDRLTYKSFLDSMIESKEFRSQFLNSLRNSEFDAFRFETPGVNINNLNQDFEFVLVNCPALEKEADLKAFSSYFSKAKDGVVSFPNLGKNAQLIVPSPISDNDCYAHIASFCRGAPLKQQHSFLETAAKFLSENISNKPLWFSTAGMGVAWLHLRIDQRPKYYHYTDYKVSK